MRDYRKSGKMPEDIPAHPKEVYGSQFKGLGDWLGTGTVATYKKEWRSFEEARGFVRELGLKNTDGWQAYCKSGQKPDDIPAAPRQVYSSEYKGMGHWLGSGIVPTRNRQYRSFEEAREFVRGLGLKSVREWQVYYKSDKRPADIPSDPYKIYGSQPTSSR